MQSPELQSKIAFWRAKADAGQMTREEWAECFAALRADRRGALAASAKPKRASAAKAVKAPVDIGALKQSLKSLGSGPPAIQAASAPLATSTTAVKPPVVGGPPKI